MKNLLQVIICLGVLFGLMAITVAVGQASFVSPKTILTVIQK
jgi:hypothetical protein